MAQKLSFGFTKKVVKKDFSSSAFRPSSSNNQSDQNKEKITAFDEKEIKTTLKNKEKENDLVIPLIKYDRELIFKKIAQEVEHDETLSETEDKKKKFTKEDLASLSLEERAIKEICNEGITVTEDSKTNEISSSATKFADLNADGDPSDLHEYETVSVHKYGAALLRGMGWRNEGVGKMNKVVNIVESTNRTFSGVNVKRNITEVDDEEELVLENGSHVYVHSGRHHKGTYGIVESIDEDHILIRPSRGGKIFREVEANFNVVTKKEYKDQSRVVNKEMFDEYKRKESHKKMKKSHKEEKSHRKEEHRSSKSDKSSVRTVETKQVDHKPRSKESDGKKYRPNYESEKKYSSMSHKEEKEDFEKEKFNEIPWVRENLRVRVVSKKYDGGRYYKEKVIVQSIETIDSCTCITEDKKKLTKIHPRWLETVIPKSHDATVLIVKGSSMGEVARILDLEKDKERATLQLLEDESVVLTKYFDDICEYVR